ncbi:serine/threonine-protein kinase [Actinoplanes campanulatus]|uniref:non-specific serine/threonine protein kinase n=1 Tax=Actinoplanes campanulatus TaxID=113559 RepID=A0A7W5FIB4_9ACTN|nr:serine/threonine-protein kinase [Actinoplanes campanulatus]MBB3099548.1 serine/threonine-protein kinase [Actinoplanes campanulatus]GGN42304.1 serine/threonine protein kinase [Actinoplanes campanulatus]GID39897.1 serine/threonine protein kinase [Actinoplanes campanulatus]
MHEVWPAPDTLLASRYRLVTLLETGGMAQVWRAADELLDRPVAVKLPAGDTRAAHLAWREARLAARLSHPGIAAVHDYREAVRPDGSVAPFVVMELLDGETVAARLCDAGGPMPWGEAVSIGTAVAEALAAAHAAGVVHRDIKPGNVMLCPGGVKLLDFGISAAAGEPDDDETGVSFGTPAYAAPERLDGKPAEPATDLYGLGVLLFEMVTGEPPYDVNTWEELALAQANGPTPLPEALPARLRELILRCLDEDPLRRPTAAQARRVLSRLIPAAPARLTIPLPGRPPTGLARVLPTPAAAPERSPLPRRLAVGAALAVTAIAFIAVINAVGDSQQDAEFAQPPSGAPTTTAPVESESTAPPAPPPATSVTTRPSPTATLTVDVALSRVRAAVERGEDRGEIRPDVALDFMNLLRLIDPDSEADITDQVDQLTRKVRERLNEGGLTESQAAVLQQRLADLRGLLTTP